MIGSQLPVIKKGIYNVNDMVVRPDPGSYVRRLLQLSYLVAAFASDVF